MLPERRRRLEARLVALTDVHELRGVRPGVAGGLEIGALCTHAHLAAEPSVRDFCPALADAFGRVATLRVRNQATLGGNLALADPAHDPPAILIALGARALLAHRDRRRELDIADLARGPFAPTLAGGELITAVRIPPLDGLRVAHEKFVVRAGSFREQAGYPTVSCGVALELDEAGRCLRARVGLSGVHRFPVRAYATEELLRHERLTPPVVHMAARAAGGALDPLDDERGSADYKRAMAAVWIERALLRAVGDRDG